MGLETGTRIQDLDASNPATSDAVGQGDDHIRLIKTCLQGSFPSLGANAVTATADQINLLTSLSFNFVTSFNSRQGDVVPAADDYDLEDMADVGYASLASENALVYNGAVWTNRPFRKHIGGMNTTGTAQLGALAPPSISIPSNVNEIEIAFYNVALAAINNNVFVEFGDSASYAMTSEGRNMAISASGPEATRDWGSNLGALVFNQQDTASSNVYTGIFKATKSSVENRWFVSSQLGASSSSGFYLSNGWIYLAGGALDRIRITASGSTFTGGEARVRISG